MIIGALLVRDKKMSKKSASPNFDTAMEELEEIVNQLEAGDLSLDESLAAYERGINLARQCEKALDTVERKVQKLLEDSDGIATVAMDEEELSKLEESES